ncbi:tetratricopeptide repeat protein [Acetobacter oeni]|uniref:Uncharacterized protein n=1 Tax=Acetobacter oeni TaxID=304077 RepID=A0A511XKW8_9PROT|nr:tetratricopeptide repeat protein [Acetobacter oeni]MBB3883248.1 tetratricopeptide (TPR) repeat protein [Acetobacter oeni]NHO19314.1 tetratricopeptide repeat protein [Acetobacter oeni]GBR07195.1 TPR repeat-containing protein [Acetobacter oeni LMG 21952]GEN63603.1 hypothetical protein AOE01nite_18270 [Acetobacter oeni]
MEKFKKKNDVQKYISKLTTLLENNEHIKAIDTIRHGLKNKPEWAEGYALLGRLLWQTGVHDEAMTAFRTAVTLQPETSEWKLSLLSCEVQLGQLDRAVPELLRIISENINNVSVVIEAVSLISLASRHDIAAASLKWCVRKRPDEPRFPIALASELISAGHPAEGCAVFIDLIKQSPDNISYTPLIVSALGHIGEFQYALDISEVYNNSPEEKSPPFLNNMACALGALNRSNEAIPLYEEAFRKSPDDESIRFGLASAYLKNGDYEKGWTQNELRPAVLKRPEKKPWRGEEDLNGKTLLLLGDQGLGDCIQFVRYIRFLSTSGTRLVLAVPAPLVRLFSNMPYDMDVHALDRLPLEHDLSCPLLSLPFALMRYIGTEIPSDVPYLKAYSEDVSRFGTLPGPARKKRVGIVWSGAERPQYGIFYRARSSSLEGFAPVLEQTQVEFVSLQTGKPRDELSASRFQHVPDPMGDVRDMADTAAIIQTLDLVISVDTSVAHLAGAMGKPVWMLTRSDCCWRWLEHRDDTPWYPTMKIFRSQPGSLDHAISLAARELSLFSKNTSPAEAHTTTHKKHEALT